MTDADFTMRAERMKAAARIRDLENELAEARAEVSRLTQRNWATAIREQDELREARAQIADQNDALVEAANLRTDLRAQIATLKEELDALRSQS